MISLQSSSVPTSCAAVPPAAAATGSAPTAATATDDDAADVPAAGCPGPVRSHGESCQRSASKAAKTRIRSAVSAKIDIHQI